MKLNLGRDSEARFGYILNFMNFSKIQLGWKDGGEILKTRCLDLKMQILLIFRFKIFQHSFLGRPEFGTIPIIYKYFDRLGMDIEYPITNFLGTISIFCVKLTVFWSHILLLFSIKILISGLNSGVTSDKKVSRKYILMFWLTISFSKITKYLFDWRFDFLTRFELSAKSAFTRLKSQGNDKEVGGSGVENENVRFLKISEVWKYKCQMF